jgi:hypothetical protein
MLRAAGKRRKRATCEGVRDGDQGETWEGSIRTMARRLKYLAGG